MMFLKVFLYIFKKSKQRCEQVMQLLVKILHLDDEEKGFECCVKGLLWKEWVYMLYLDKYVLACCQHIRFSNFFTFPFNM
jgi:hypothetical protein